MVKDAVRELTQKNQEVFVPLVHRPGEAQVDFGHALAKVNGRLRKVAYFVMALPYSDASFVMAFERECTETFWDGHGGCAAQIMNRPSSHRSGPGSFVRRRSFKRRAGRHPR